MPNPDETVTAGLASIDAVTPEAIRSLTHVKAHDLAAAEDSYAAKRKAEHDKIAKELGMRADLGGRVFEVKVKENAFRTLGMSASGPAFFYLVNGIELAADDFLTLLAIARANEQAEDLGALRDLASDIKRDMRR